MNMAEYRIVITHEPGEAFTAYRAQVFNLAGDWQVSKYGETAEAVEQEAREWVERATAPADAKRTLWVDGAGRDAAAPTSTAEGTA